MVPPDRCRSTTPLHPAAEHCEREDVRVHLVLVLDFACPAHRPNGLPVRWFSLIVVLPVSYVFPLFMQRLHHLHAKIPAPSAECPQPYDSNGDMSLAVPQAGHWGLVAHLHAGPQSRSGDLQGRDERVCQAGGALKHDRAK